ncbi:ATP synthase F1, gamma subunit [Plesiocystis pacifica SIR-1]|uniref:ATP synthase gamma chain n=1 Tax=Plesiocystis pacifica SIR-1 TaxID=391625 RepID=A6G263_9BACT|nr:ATP synthase F1 subunit gamma [Plesiocystis pacifica]EDM80032.1 ATP synthase F1, gamma subunit [Plesiocystis pacifica SIR-1]
MANLKEIRIRIKSVKNTRKITSAMSRIAAARLRRAQLAMEAARDYGTRMAGIVGEILSELEDAASLHPLLAEGQSDAVAYVVITADRGLCGGFNSAVNRQSEREIKALREAGREVHVITVGRKGRDYLRATTQVTPLSHHTAPNKPEEVVDVAKGVANELIALFEGRWELEDTTGDGEGDTLTGPKVGEIRVVYNYFKNVITQEVRDEQMLPVPMPEPIDADGDGVPDEPREAVREAVRAFEPETEELLAHLLPTAVETAVQQALYNSVAAEVAARRAAMDNATDNATELIGELTLQYNRERQAAITKELMEIIGGAEALKG